MDLVKHLVSVTVENLARRYEISRNRDGESAVASKQKAEAVAPGVYAEVRTSAPSPACARRSPGCGSVIDAMVFNKDTGKSFSAM
jgi:hypothetical protein